MASSHEHTGKNGHRERARQAPKRGRASQGTAGEGSGQTFQIIFTLSTSGAVTKIEQIDAAGNRREVPMGETRTLVGEDNCHEIEATLDEAFEAGISSVVEPGDRDDDDAESEEDVELRRVLLTGIVGPEVRRRLQRRLVQRLALSRTLRH